VSEKHKSTSLIIIQAKNQRTTIIMLHAISRLEIGERIVDIGRNIRSAHISVFAIRDNADRITDSAKSGTKVFV
jgi:hypothetical protein